MLVITESKTLVCL